MQFGGERGNHRHDAGLVGGIHVCHVAADHFTHTADVHLRAIRLGAFDLLAEEHVVAGNADRLAAEIADHADQTRVDLLRQHTRDDVDRLVRGDAESADEFRLQSGLFHRCGDRLAYTQIIKDLQEAKNLLPENYDAAGRTRPNKWAAAALLARVYLYRQSWAQAEGEATEVINAPAYTLLNNPNDVFLAASKEAIWQLVPVNVGFNTAEGNAFVPASATVKPAYAATAALLNAFEPGDTRRTAWLKANTISSVAYYFPFKYKVRSGTALTEYNTVLRLAELYLVRAEARTRQNKLPEAQQDLNVIRSRASLPNTTATTEAGLVLAIEKERQTELFAEWGHRWLDLKRTGRIDAVLSAAKPGWQSTAALYPIPLAELLANPFLTQNPGY